MAEKDGWSNELADAGELPAAAADRPLGGSDAPSDVAAAPEPEVEVIEPPRGPLVAEREAALAAVRANGFALQLLPEALSSDREVVLAAVTQNGLALQCAPAELRGDVEVVAAALAKTPNVLQHADAALLGDKSAVMALVAQDSDALKFASPELCSDREVVLAAVAKKHWVLQCASEELRGDRDFMMEAVKANPRTLRYASLAVRADKEVVLAAVRKYGMALESASTALRNDDEVVLLAVRKHGMALQFGSMQLRDDRRVVMEALLQNKHSWRYASRRLHQDPETMAAQGLDGDEAAILKNKSEKQLAAKVAVSEDGFVEYRKPWQVHWPVVIVAPYGGDLAPDDLPDRRTGCKDACWRSSELAEEVWEAFVVGSPGPPALVRMRLARKKLDADVPRSLAADGCEAALRAYDCYHEWLTEALRECVHAFGLAVILDVRGQSHRRGVTELGYLLTAEDLLLFDNVLDVAAPHATSIDALFRAAKPGAGRPGGLSSLIRGPMSLGGLLEKQGLKAIPCPRIPEPVDCLLLESAKAGFPEPDFPPEEKEVLGERVHAYLCGGYTARRYAVADTLLATESPLPAADQDSWARSVAAVQVEASWDVRKERESRQRFGHVLMGAMQTYLKAWIGWTP